jgi:CheY-like chemotaxis protein
MPSASLTRRTILVVEDDPLLAETMAELLQEEGYTVVSVPNGQNALNYLRHNPAPHLILLDLMMPVLDGFQFRREQMRDRALARIPVIVLSAMWRNEHLCPMAVADWFGKPADTSALLRSIERHSNPLALMPA